MKIAVAGLWHLGTVTAGCLANAGFDVVGYDPADNTVEMLRRGELPVAESGLAALFKNASTAGHLTFSSERAAVRDCDIVWVAFDTPVDADDRADVDFVIKHVEELFPYLKLDALVLISSQLPAGSTGKLEDAYRRFNADGGVHFAYSPENLRLGKAVEVFTRPERVIVGVRRLEDRTKIAKVFAPFTENVIWMSVESAEVTKHAINAFLATSVVFINELATLCERIGADAREVEQGLKSEARIGPRAYLRAGGAFAGGTLARDISFLMELGAREGCETSLFSAVKHSNESHRNWPRRKFQDLLGKLNGRKICVLGLTYKPGTSTLRRSTAVELCQWLKAQGCEVSAYDPAAETLPDELKFIQRGPNVLEACTGADAIVVATEWPEFKTVDCEKVIAKLKQPIVLDAGSFLEATWGKNGKIRYFCVGHGA